MLLFLQGIDLKAAQRKLQDLGFAPVAYLMLTDAWRKESPRCGQPDVLLGHWRYRMQGSAVLCEQVSEEFVWLVVAC